MALEFFLFTVTICLLLHCSASKAVTTAILFLARALGSGLFQTAYVYTPEVRLRDKSNVKHRHLINIYILSDLITCSQVYPTVLRSVGVGTCAGVARFGAMLTPYIAQVRTRVRATCRVC